ncbi:hypothetical protein [Photobacterium halotolerans]|uniref:Uncharacterized protein n=1 Tax=Photobacterium halotolerans TaxID=265726 RepID=A0A7X5ASX9_9GAMM|nr:hypothetical protein [Photobacterium halotolerans]NAW66724.1 hypothetical protein [Photobacterium halotolerans]
MAAFDEARALLRASVLDCFSNAMLATAPDGSPLSFRGYVRSQETEGRAVYSLMTDDELPEQSTMDYNGKPYQLVFQGPAQGRGNDESQLIRQYTMNLIQAGVKRGWSEYPDGG